MAERHGGMRRPQNPAPVSGPGQLSQRTDGGPQQVQADMTGGAYGDNQAMEALQSMAPMSASPSAASPSARAREARRSGQAAGGASMAPLFSQTQYPDEPVTAGAPFGPGDGPPSYPGMDAINQQDAQLLSRYLPDMMVMAEDPNTPDGFRRFVRHLRNIQGGF